MKENNITQNNRQRIKICTLFLSAAVFAVMYYIHLNIDNLPWDGYVFRWLTHESRPYNRIIFYEVFALIFALIGWWRVSNMLTFGSWLLIIAGDIFGSIPGDYSNPDNYIPDRDNGVPIYIIGMLLILITGGLMEFWYIKKQKNLDACHIVKNEGGTHMNENRPAWERKLDREYIWKKVMAVLVILGIAVMLLLLLYHIPLVTDYNKTFTGYELHYDPETDPTYENPATVKGSKVRFEGKLYRYLFRTDYFDGLVYFDDFTTLPNSKYVISDTTQIFYSANDVWLSAVVNPLWGLEIKRGKNERICWAFVNFDRKNEIFAFNISIGDEADNSWSLSDNYIVVPAETPEEAAEMYHERIWQMMQDDIAKAEKEQAIEPVKTIEGNLKTYYEMSDGTWQFEGHTYKYRLVISGRQPFAVKDTTYVYLSNIEDIPFGKAMMASGLSSNTKDYFTREEAVLVEIE